MINVVFVTSLPSRIVFRCKNLHTFQGKSPKLTFFSDVIRSITSQNITPVPSIARCINIRILILESLRL